MTGRATAIGLALGCALLLGGCAGLKPGGGDPVAGYAPNPQPAQESEFQYRARLHTELGANYYARGQFDVALEELNEGLKLVPDHAPALNVMALVYMELGDFNRAEGIFVRALALASSDPEIRNNFGWFLCLRDRERDGLAQFQLALSNSLYRTPELALLNAGRCSMRLGDLRGAETYYRRALAASSNNPKALYGLADIAYREARFADARAMLKGALVGNPPPEVVVLAACVERRLGDPKAEAFFTNAVRSRFPDAPELRRLAADGCQ